MPRSEIDITPSRPLNRHFCTGNVPTAATANAAIVLSSAGLLPGVPRSKVIASAATFGVKA
jgi:hypothetical protein